MVLIIRKKASFLLAIALLLSCAPRAAAEGEPPVSAACAIVLHSSGMAVYEKDADRRCLIASTTKLMTALVSLERAAPEEEILILPAYCAVEGTAMGLRPGERYTVRELLTGLLLASGNDAALALAGGIAGDVDSFVGWMNEKARDLGLQNTSFANPHGLDAQGHYSTARDLGLLMLACMEREDFRTLCGSASATVKGVSYQNHNKLLRRCQGCIAGKTGYTRAAGRCLVSVCRREGTELVCVTLSDPDDWTDHERLYDWAFARYGQREIGGELRFSVPLVFGAEESALAEPDGICLFLPKEAELRLIVELPRICFAPVSAGERAGTLRVLLGDQELARVPIRYIEDISAIR